MGKKGFALVLGLVAALLLAVGCGGSSGGGEKEPLNGSAKVTVSFKAPAAKLSARPAGTVYDVASVTIDAESGGTFYASGLAFVDMDGTWFVTVPALPVGPTVNFTAHAYNGIGTEIFTGTATAVLTAFQAKDLTIVMSVIDNGLPVVIPSVTSITKPAEILFDDTVSISFGVKAGVDDVLLCEIIASNGGTFTPTSDTLYLTGTTGSIAFDYTAPSMPGTYQHTIRITNSSGDYVTTAFNTYVVSEYSNVARTSVLFMPVIESIGAYRQGTDVYVAATLADNGDFWPLSYDMSYTDNVENMDTVAATDITIFGYDANSAYDMSLTVYYGSGLSTTLNWTIPAGQFPDQLGIVTLDVSASGMGSISGGLIGTTSSATQEFDYGTTITLTAVPDFGENFLGWLGGCSGTDPECVLTLTQDTSVLAQFSNNQARMPATPMK